MAQSFFQFALFVVFDLVVVSQRCFGWDHFVFTQQWPQAVCLANTNRKCSVPRNVTHWTVHGLWPNDRTGILPNYCNKSAIFDPTKVLPIEPQLQMHWPNLFHDSPLDDFWKHEWLKHGTCCQDLTATVGELNYFRTGLVQNSVYNISLSLAKHSIVPTDSSGYKYSDVEAALENTLGKTPDLLSCYYDKSKRQQTLLGIELCLDKTFAVIDCPTSTKHLLRSSLGRTEPCWKNETVYYPTIQHEGYKTSFSKMMLIKDNARVSMYELMPVQRRGNDLK